MTVPSPAPPAGSASSPPQSHGAQLDLLLAELLRRVPELEAAAVVTADGLPMASALPRGMDEDRVAAMSAALLSLGERAAEGLGRGGLSQVYIQGEDGGVWLLAAGDDAVLVGVSAADAKAGLVLYELRRATAAVGTALAADELAAIAERASIAARAASVQARPEPAAATAQPAPAPRPTPAAPLSSLPTARPAGQQPAPVAQAPAASRPSSGWPASGASGSTGSPGTSAAWS